MKKSQFLKIIWAPITILVGHAIFASTIGHRQVDPIFHFLGGVAAGYFFYQILNLWLSTEMLLPKLLFSFTLSCTVFLVWEIAEFCSDQLLGTHIQISVTETMNDVILGVTGLVLLLLVIYVSTHSNESV